MNRFSWPKKKVEDLFEVQLGKMLNEKAKQGELFPYLANFNVRWGSFDLSRLNEMTFSEKERKKYSLSPGDLLMCEGGEIGRCAIWKESEKQIFYQKALHRLRPLNNNIKPEFIYYYMEHIASRDELPKLVGETSIAHLTREKLLSLRVPLPCIAEQIAITDLLSTWDAAIEKTEQLFAAKVKRFYSFIQELISTQCNEWGHIQVKNMFETVSEKKKGEQELLSVTQDRGVIPRSMLEGRVMSPEGSTDGYKLIKKGDFAISLRSFQGGIEYSEYQGLISPAYTVLRPKLEIHHDFYRHFFKSYLFIKKYLNIAVIGIRDGKQISIPDFMTVKIPYPPLKRQISIAETLNTAQQEIDILKKQAEAYRKQKRGLMQKLLTGKWRVNTAREVA